MAAPIIPLDGFRFFTKGNSVHPSVAFQYVQDSGIVWQDDNVPPNTYTGAFRPMNTNDMGNMGGVFNAFITGVIPNAVGVIPAGALTWSTLVQQGVLTFNGVNIFATGTLIKGGGYGGKTLATNINYSGNANCNAIVTYEV